MGERTGFLGDLRISRGSAVTVFVDVECVTSDLVPFIHKKKLVLPQTLLGAALSIRTHLHINRILDIPDSACKKTLKLHVNDKSRLLRGFDILLEELNKASKSGLFELIVEGV